MGSEFLPRDTLLLVTPVEKTEVEKPLFKSRRVDFDFEAPDEGDVQPQAASKRATSDVSVNTLNKALEGLAGNFNRPWSD